MKNTKTTPVVPLLVIITILIIGIWGYLFMQDQTIPQISQTSPTKVSPFNTKGGLYSFQKIDEIGARLAKFLNAYHVSLSVNGFPQVTVGANYGGPSPVSYESEQNRVNLMYSVYYPNCTAHYVANYFLELNATANMQASEAAKNSALTKFKNDLTCLGKVTLTPVAVSQF